MMSDTLFMTMNQSDFYQQKLLIASSKEEFLQEYKKYDETTTKKLYSRILLELEKAIFANNIENFLLLCKAIFHISSLEKPALLKDYFNDVNNPIRDTNLVILTCKHNKIAILKLLFGSCSGILYNLSAVVGKATISPTDEDEFGFNALYYAMRSGNVELLNQLTCWPGNYFPAHPEKLDEILSKSYEELKLKNVPVSDEMEIFVENKLIDLRFFSNSLSQNQIAKHNHNNVKERIKLVIEHFNLLNEDYANTDVIDEKFLFVTKSIAQNIHILKKKLKSTYGRLPWEEMEFCLIIFISSHSKQQELNLIYQAILNKGKLLNYLEHFTVQLMELNSIIDSTSISDLTKLPTIRRDKIIDNIINNYPQFSQLYNDYQQIRDIYSLERMNMYIKLALSVSPKEKEGHLIITRVLQVIGEYLKNSLESPNLSVRTAELLLQSLQKNTREVIIGLRNSLSHADCLSKRTEIEANTDVSFFTLIQNDAKKVGDVIADILYKKKIEILKTLLNKIINSENLDEINNILKILKNAELEKQIHENFEMLELIKLEKLINELNSKLQKKTLHEEELINRIDTALKLAKSKYEDDMINYAKGHAALVSMTYCHKIDHNDTETMKLRANIILKNILHSPLTFSFKEIAELTERIFHSAQLRMQNDALDDIRRLVLDIYFIIEFDTNNIKWIEELRRDLTTENSFNPKNQQQRIHSGCKEDNYQLSSKLSELKEILNNNSLNDECVEKLSFYKKDKKLQAIIEMLVLDIMSILGCSKHYLENNVLYLDDSTPLLTGKCLRNHLAHDNILVDALLGDPSVTVALNAKKLTEENLLEKKRKIGKAIMDDPLKVRERFSRRLSVIINQEKMFLAAESGNIDRFKDCLMKGADINARNLDLWTTLHYSAKGCSLEIVKFILNQNVNANMKNIEGQTPLHIAAIHGRTNIVECFINDACLCIDDVDKHGKTPLHYAAQNGHKDTVRVLLNYKPETAIVENDMIFNCVLPPLYQAIMNNHVDVCKILMENNLGTGNECLGGYTPLHTAAECGHLEVLNFLLENGADVNSRNDRNWTPIHAAAFYGHLEVVRALIFNKANVNARVINGCTPLHYAIESGHVEITNILLIHGANFNAVDKTCLNTPLHIAARYGRDEIVKILLNYVSHANTVNRYDATPLHVAARFGHFDVVSTLLNYGVNVQVQDKTGATPLYYATLQGHQDVVELLLQNGADTNISDKNGLMPLHVAALKGHKDTVNNLIKNKSNVNAQDIKGNTAMHAAAQNGFTDVIDILVKNKSGIDAKNNFGFTPLFIAALNGHKNAVDFLVKNNAEINSRNVDGLTPLHAAVNGGHKDIVKYFIKNKADINAKNVEGLTPLHIAIELGFKEIAEILIENNANVNAKVNSVTPLISAIKRNNKELVEVLIKNGVSVSDLNDALLLTVSIGNKDILEILLKNKAQVNTKYMDNCTLLHLAADRGYKETVNILIKRGAKINAMNKNKETPLYLAARKGHEEIVEICIAHGANITVVNDEGLTPLHAAAASGHINVVKTLLNKKIDINVKDYQNRTPFEFAVSFGHLQVVKILWDYQKIDLNAKGNDDWTVLHIAAQGNNLEVVKFLINKGSNINAKNSSGSKPVHIAAREGFLDAVKFFLSVGSSTENTGTDNQTVLHYAVMKNHLKVVEYLIAQGANVNAVDNNGCSPMLMAVAFGFKNIVKVLLQNGALYKKSIFLKNYKFMVKSLGEIMEMPQNKEMKKLLTCVDKLYNAVKTNSPSDVENMIKAGAPVDARYRGGLTPLHYAIWKGYDRIVTILLQHKANPNIVDSDGFTPLHYAARFSTLKTVKTLLQNGAIYNAVCCKGKTPLYFATEKEVIDLLKLIDESFQNIKMGNSAFVKHMSKIKDITTIKAIMTTHNEEHKTLIVVAMLNDFPEVEYLKEIFQDNVSTHINKAEMLLETGNCQKALSMFKTIFEKRKELFGPDNPAALDIQKFIAKAFIRLGDYHKALSIYEEIFRKQNEIFGFNFKDTLSTKSSVALVLHLLGRNHEALDDFRNVYQKQKEILGSSHVDTLDTQFYMALVLDQLGKYEEALNINREVFKKRKEKNPDDPAVLQAENNIAMVLSNQGKYEEALEIYKNVFNKKKEVLGLNHSSTLRTLSNIAGVLSNQKKYQEALKTHQEVLNIQKTVLGPNHPDTLYTKYNLGTVFFIQTKWTNALRVFTEVLDQSKLTLGSNHPIVLDASEKLKLIDEVLKLQGIDSSEVLQHLQKDIYSASSDGDVEAVQQLLNAGTDVNNKDINGRTALHYAISNGQMSVIKVLLKHGADVTQVTNKGNTPLHTATSTSNIEIVQILLQHVHHEKLSDFINAKTTSTGTTSLHIAAKNNSFEIVKILLKHGAVFNIENKQGQTPLSLSSNQSVSKLLIFIEELFSDASKGNEEIKKKLLAAKLDERFAVMNCHNKEGRTLLQVALAKNHKNISKMLIEQLKRQI